MSKTKIIELLTSFSPEEMRQFDKFVRSPIHNKHENVVNLFGYLRKNLNNCIDNFPNEKVYERLFPNEQINMQKLHHVSSYLLKVAEEYLAWKEWKKNPVDVGLALTKALKQHKIDNQFQKSLSNTKKENKIQPLRDANFYHNEYHLLFEEFKYANTLGRTIEMNLQKLADTQDIAYIIEKLRNASLLLSHQAVSKKAYDSGLLSHIMEFLKDHRYLSIPSVSIYYNAYLALSDQNNEDSFLKLKAALFDKRLSFDIEELKGLYIIAINFCIKKLNTDNINYKKEAFELYQAGLKKDIFFNNEEFSPWTYSNIVQVGLMLKEFDIVENFIKKYRKYLPVNKQEAYYSYNYAWFFYQKKDYSNAMQLLLRTDYGGDVLITCTAKTLLARMYLELNEMESLDSLLKSFNIFIRRKKVLAYHKELYVNFIRFVKQLSTINSSDRSSTTVIAKEIRSTKVVAAKEWLLDQLVERKTV